MYYSILKAETLQDEGLVGQNQVPTLIPKAQGQKLDHQRQGQRLKNCSRGHLKDKDQGQEQQH